MNTFLLLWNPAISSYTIDHCDEEFDFKEAPLGDFIDDEQYFSWDLNWSVREWEKARKGDRFFMLRVGEGQPNGIVDNPNALKMKMADRVTIWISSAYLYLQRKTCRELQSIIMLTNTLSSLPKMRNTLCLLTR